MYQVAQPRDIREIMVESCGRHLDLVDGNTTKELRQEILPLLLQCSSIDGITVEFEPKPEFTFVTDKAEKVMEASPVKVKK